MVTKSERRGLGRGLSALMAEIEPPVSVQVEADTQTSAPRRADFLLPVEKIIPNPLQPRRDFPAQALEELAASLRQHGLIQPIIVRPSKENGFYEIVAGERRWRAAQMAQLHELPVVLRNFSDTEVLEVAIIENIQRADLNPIEEAMAFRQLMDSFGHTQEKLAEALAKSRSYIANLLRLLNLPDDVQDHLRNGRLTAGHARALITAKNPSELARQVIAHNLSVRETEALAKNKSAKTSKSNTQTKGSRVEKDADTRAIEADLSANLKMAVTINHESGGEAGILQIRYKTLDDLDNLCRSLSVMSQGLEH